MITKVLKMLVVAFPLLLASALAHADLVDDIKQRGELICGTLGTSQPFSFQDPDTRELVGYDIDICKLVADKLGVSVRYKLLSVAARIPELKGGRVDILAANLGWNPARDKQIDYSYLYYLTPQKLLVRADSDIHEIADLKGHRIGATKGSSSAHMVKELLPETEVVGYANSPSTYLALQQHKVDAQIASELVLVRLAKESPESAPTRTLKEPLFVEPWGLGIREENDHFRKLVNDALKEAEASGKAAELFEKWFGKGTPYGVERSFVFHPLNAS